MKYARVPMRTETGGICHKVVKGRIHLGAFEIENDEYPPTYDNREMRVVRLISEQEYFKALLNGEG